MNKAIGTLATAGLALFLAACGNTTPQQAQTTDSTDQVLQTAPASDPTATTEATIVPGEAIVKFRENTATTQSFRVQALNATIGEELAGGERLVSLAPSAGAQALNATSTLAAIEALKARPDVEYAQPNYLYQPTRVPNDTYYSLQWHYPQMNLPAAWDLTTGSGSPVVAVIDTGKTAHPDLNGRWVGGYDFISSASVARDGNGRDADATDVGDGSTTSNSSWHGTHVAGTIGANTNNASGVAGINWSARILPLRVLGAGGGSTSDIIAAIRWAAGISVTGVPANAYPAKVINMSLGGYVGSPCASSDPATQAAINDATARGVVVVVAAGNSNADASRYTPASCNNTVTVAATETRNYRAPYSNYGSYIDVAAPGGDTSANRNGDSYADGILSTLKSSTGAYNYAFYQGTSMAAPHVAGLASLMLARYPSLTPAQVLSKLKSTATPLTSTQCPQGCGAGLVNAYKAVQ